MTDSTELPDDTSPLPPDQPSDAGRDTEPTASGKDQEALTDILVACDERLAAGDEPSTDASIEGADDSLAPQLKRSLACLRLLDRLRPGRISEEAESVALALSNDPADSSWRHGDPTRIGRFQIRRKLGHGGFGVVYLAYDPQLRRQVALKVPHPRTILTRELRERFQLEAAAAAGLDHPNVVPVFDSGETGAVSYIASAYCPGISLATWLRGREEPVSARSAASLVAQIADGVQHAHERGILHRDLKPGNVLLTPLRGGKPIEESPTIELSATLAIDAFDFLPRITDFGMAKRVGEWESDGAINEDPAAPLTKTGAVMGTPSYMAPEQAAGRTKDVAAPTDVHGLGIILYELLTGQTPYLAESTFDTLRRVQNDEPLPPRKFRPKLPRDLETICLKCLQKEPKRRYQTAAELADDLRRFLEGKSILARSVGPVERAWRWSLREPLVAGLLTTLVVVVFAAIAGLSFLFMDARHQARLARDGETKANAARLAETQARNKAEERLQQVRSMLDNITSVARSLSSADPAQRKLRRDLLEDSLNLHEVFIVEQGDNPAVLHKSAMAYQTIAQLRVDLGQIDPAQIAYERAGKLFDRINELDPATPRYRIDRAWNSYWYGYLLLRRKNLVKEAEVQYDRAIEIVQGLLNEAPTNTSFQSAMAVITMNWAGIQIALGRPERAEQAYPRSINLYRQALKTAPRAATIRADLALCLDAWASLMLKERYKAGGKAMLPPLLCTGLSAPVRASVNGIQEIRRIETTSNSAMRESINSMRALVKQSPDVRTFQYSLSRIRNHLATVLFQAKAQKESVELLRESVATMKSLLSRYDDSFDYRVLLVETTTLLARELPAADRKESIALYYQSLEHAEKLVTQFPDSRYYKNQQARILYSLINRLLPDRLPEGINYLDGLVRRQPNHAIKLSELSWFLATRPGVTIADRARALDLVRRSITAPLVSLDQLHKQGVSQYRKENYLAARSIFEQCVKERANPIPEDYLYLSMAFWNLGDRDQARKNYSTALRLINLIKPLPADLQKLQAEVEAMFTPKPRI